MGIPQQERCLRDRLFSHIPETAPIASLAILDGFTAAIGFTPNVQAIMAESPELLSGYVALLELFNQTSLSPTERHIVNMTTSFEHGGKYCMAYQTTMAQRQQIDDAIVMALRDGAPLPDAKLDALRLFSTASVHNRGRVDEARIHAFVDAGYTPQAAFEILLGVAIMVMSNYVTHLAPVPLDDVIRANELSKPATAHPIP